VAPVTAMVMDSLLRAISADGRPAFSATGPLPACFPKESRHLEVQYIPEG
jgi:hypothetical protein